MSRPIRLLPAFMTVGVWTLASRILGFVRDILIAGFLGSGPVAEAFLIAFSLPNLFRRFFAEGAFNMAFIPLFSKKLEAGEGAEDFARDALSALATILIILTLVAQIAMPALVYAMASGFAEDERFTLTTAFARITFPYILFISIAALLSGALNAMGRFWAAAAAPVFLNIVLIAAMLLATTFGWDIGWSLAIAVPIAGIAQAVMLWQAAAREGLRLTPRMPRLTPELKRLAIIAAPAALAGGVVQINLLVGRQVASHFEGAVAWLNYADRLYQLPLGLVGIAIGVVLLPDLSRRLGAGDREGGIHQINRAFEFSLALALPSAVALIVIAGPLTSVLFERGAFTSAHAAATATAVAIYGAGLPAFVLQKVISPVFFAREDTRRPFHYALVSMVVNAALAIGLSPVIGYLAAAVGTTLSAYAMLALLWYGARHHEGAIQLDNRLKSRIPRLAVASVIMGLACYGTALVLADALIMPTLRYAALAALIFVGMATYAASAYVLGALRPSDLKAAFAKPRGADT